MAVPDLTDDPRFCDLPNVTGNPHFRFYCGAPLINGEGQALGTICVMDFKPKDLSVEQTEALRCLSHQVMAQLELRRSLLELDDSHRKLTEAHQQLDQVQHVDNAVKRDVRGGTGADGRLTEAQQQLDEVEDVDRSVEVDVTRG